MTDMDPYNPFLACTTGRGISAGGDSLHSNFHSDRANTSSSRSQGMSFQASTEFVENVRLDDFDRELLAQSRDRTFRDAISSPEFETADPMSYDMRVPEQRSAGSGNSSRLTLSNSPNNLPFSSPIVSLQKNKHHFPNKKDGSCTRNAFHDRLTQAKQEGAQSAVEQKEPTRLMARHARNPTQGPLVRGIELIPTTRLPDKQRSIFGFPVFNAVQSRCFSTTYESDDNLVVSAPTGSGKTVIMELGILRLMESLKSGHAKVVYQAPTKSLCSERYRDWQPKFGVFDIHCAELTGDTEQTYFRNVATASIIITTPEKWDSITRKWKDNAKLMNMIKLVLVDEAHILKDSRGATLEAIVSRMKIIGNNVRFIALSATIPNSEDIAEWLTRNKQNPHSSAIREVFDDSYRPVQLTKHVLGFDGPYHPWPFDNTLTEKIPELVSRYGKRKSVLVFCPTKESAQKTADKLTRSWLGSPIDRRGWNGPKVVAKVENETLQQMLPAAVAFHHGSLSVADRKTIEQGFLNCDISIICSTSTLAVGVNLPCYLVILKGTQAYTDTGLQEYSSLEIMQMLGRAGRPQFENEACAVILCLKDRSSRYKKMVAGEEVLESSLHHNLIEHLNAEIGLGTINSIQSAKRWLGSTFLNVRLQKNPQYYAPDPDECLTSDESLLQWCEKDLRLLREAALIEENGNLQSTQYGEAMARYCVKYETMKTYMEVPPRAKISQILNVLCQAVEFREYNFRVREKSFYKEINKANETRYPLKVDVALTQHKISLIIQAKLGCMHFEKDAKNKFSGGQLHQFGHDTNGVIGHAKRLIRCLVDILLQRNDSIAVKSALELARGLGAGVWDDTVMQLKQIPGIGDVSTRKLAAAGIRSIDALFNTEAHRMEVILGKNPPFGLELTKKVAEFPMLHISVRDCGQKFVPQKGVEIKLRCEVGFLNETVPFKFNRHKYSVLFMCETSYDDLIDFRRFSPSSLKNSEDIFLTATITESGAKVCCHIMCDDIAGTHRFAEVRIDCPTTWFPAKPATPKLCFQRPEARDATAGNATLEEFSNEGLEDGDLLAADQGFSSDDTVVDIDDIISERNVTEQPKNTNKRGRTKSFSDAGKKPREPQKLANGRWTCQHTCKVEGKDCRHKCCTEGVKHKPKIKKQQKDQLLDDSDVDERPKKERKNSSKQSIQKGALDRLWRPEQDGKGTSARRQPLPDGMFDGDLLPGCAEHQTQNMPSSRTVSAKPDVANDPSELQQAISDVFDFGDYDWQAMDEIAAEFDHRAGDFPLVTEIAPGEADEQSLDPLGGADYHRSKDHELPQEVLDDQKSDPSSLFFVHTSSPCKALDQSQNWQEHGTLTDASTCSFTQDTRSAIQPIGKTDGYVTMNSQRAKDLNPRVSSIGMRNNECCDTTDDIDFIEEPEYRDQSRVEEEEQKRKWAELGSDFLTHEKYGKYIRIVDSSP